MSKRDRISPIVRYLHCVAVRPLFFAKMNLKRTYFNRRLRFINSRTTLSAVYSSKASEDLITAQRQESGFIVKTSGWKKEDGKQKRSDGKRKRNRKKSHEEAKRSKTCITKSKRDEDVLEERGRNDDGKKRQVNAGHTQLIYKNNSNRTLNYMYYYR